MNPITRAVSDLRFRIPPTILETAFVKRTARWREAPKNLDNSIMESVVRPRVLVDCNLVGGVEASIPLEGAEVDVEVAEDHTVVYRIPKKLTQNRSILSALAVTFVSPHNYSSYGAVAGQNNSTMLQAGQAVMDAHGMIPVTSTARVSLIGENVVMVRDTQTLPPGAHLRCILANDETLSHIQMTSWRPFCKLVELAVKSFIYNEYIIQMDQAQLEGGVALGRFKDVIDGWADSEELYQDYLTNTWQKVAFMNDAPAYTNHLRRLIGGYR